MARWLDPDARVLVFIDGQNVYKACERLYGQGACHPLLLAGRLTGSRRLVGVRYYSGVHDPTVDPEGRSRTDRRHNLIRRTGVTVIERQLRYRWEWGFDPKLLPDQLRHEDFDAASDSFDYKQPVPKDLQDLFVDACRQIRGHFF